MGTVSKRGPGVYGILRRKCSVSAAIRKTVNGLNKYRGASSNVEVYSAFYCVYMHYCRFHNRHGDFDRLCRETIFPEDLRIEG